MKIQGIAASRGYARGRVFIKTAAEVTIDQSLAQDPEVEIQRLEEARQQAAKELADIRDKTAREVGAEEAAVFDAHAMFLEDPEFMGQVEAAIRGDGKNAMVAMDEVSRQFVEIFEAMDDEYMRERAGDVADVSSRVLRILSGAAHQVDEMPEDSIVVAKDLTPSDTAQLDKSKVVAFVTDIGGRTSHTAIMARTLEIPAVVGTGNATQTLKAGDFVIVDGMTGEVVVDPDEAALKAYDELDANYQADKEAMKELIGVRVADASGKLVEVAGNIGKPEDVAAVLENGGDGIGLYRTEFLYMDRQELPSEEEQFEAYKAVLEAMGDKPVVIRTLDIGGDKKLPYLPLPEEMNPFLGYRAIRLCLDQPDLFKVQLRALLRASSFGNLRVMFPMISGLDEFRQAMALVEECKKELTAQGEAFSQDIQWGIMVEIPSTAVLAEEFAREVDFLSIGTNDLIQYSLAADRMSEKVSYLYDPMHPAVLKLIQMTIDGGHAQGKWVGMCGEMAGEEEAIPLLLEMGLDEFSMSASSILPAKQLIKSLSEQGSDK